MIIHDEKFGERIVLSVLMCLAQENPPTTPLRINRAMQERGRGVTFPMLLIALKVAEKSAMINIQRRFMRMPVITLTALGRFIALTLLGRFTLELGEPSS